MPEPARDRWLSIGMSVLLHGSLIALLAFGWWHFRRPAPTQTLPIDATVVDARTLKGIGTAQRPAPKPKPPPPAQPQQQAPPPTQEGPPLPTPNEVAMREQAAKEEAQHEAEAQQQLLARQQAREEAHRKAEEAAAAEAAQAKAEAQAKEEAAAAQAKKLADARKKAEAKKLAAAKLAEQRKLAEEKALADKRAAAERAARVAELQQSLQEDEQAKLASGALASWTNVLKSRIQQHWMRPPTAQQGIDCVLNVSLVSGGDVTDVSIGDCNGDDAVRESIKNAVYAASPLPPPPNNIAFPHQLQIEFKPD